MGPYPLAITRDGQYAYVSMVLSPAIFKIRLSDMVIVGAADLSAYWPLESWCISLDASEDRLFVQVPVWRRLLVMDTHTMSVVHSIDDIGAIGMVRSRADSSLITWDGGSTVSLVNTDTYSVTRFVDDQTHFKQIRASETDPDLWFVVSQMTEISLTVGLYDPASKGWRSRVSVPLQQGVGEGIFDLRVLPNEQKAYLATFGDWYPDYHAYGWVYAIDLAGGQVEAIPIDGGAFWLEAGLDSRSLYVGTGWPMPNTNNLLVVDTGLDVVIGTIPLGRNLYGWPRTQINDLLIDPAHPWLLYATCGDSNDLLKMDLRSRTLLDALVFNRETFLPHFYAVGTARDSALILLHRNANALALDLDQAMISDVVRFPAIRTDTGAYDVAFTTDGRALIAQGEHFLELESASMRLLESHPLPGYTPSVWHFVLSRDQTRIYAITYSSSGEDPRADTFLALDAASLETVTTLRLEGGGFEFRPFETPDRAKLYALGGLQNGAVVLHVIDTDTWTVRKTITFDEPGLEGISTGPYFPFAYDASSHTLFVGATQVVLAIDTDADVIRKVILLGDVARALGLEPAQLTYINAIGLVYQPGENLLYIAHLDYSFISIYDLTDDRFLPQVIPLHGYFPRALFSNGDCSKIYCLNGRSDSVSVIDTSSRAEENVIDLHAYLHEYRVFVPVLR